MRPIDIRKLTKRDSVNTDYRLTIDKDNNQCLTKQPDKSLTEDELKALPVRDALVTDKRLTLDSANNFVMTNQPDNSAIGTAASKDTGTLPDQIPLNSDLGTSATKDVGTLSGQVPTNGDLGSASVVNVGTAQDQIETNALKDFKSFDSLTSAIAYVTANPDNIKRLDTSSYRSSAECTTLGIAYPDGGSASYIVVASGTGTADGMYIIDAGSAQLQLLENKNGANTLYQIGALFDGSDETTILQAFINSPSLLIDIPEDILTTTLLTSSIDNRVFTSSGGTINCTNSDATCILITGNDNDVSLKINGMGTTAQLVLVRGERCKLFDGDYQNTFSSINPCRGIFVDGATNSIGLGCIIERNNFVNMNAAQFAGAGTGGARAIEVYNNVNTLEPILIRKNNIKDSSHREGGCIQVLFFDGAHPFLENSNTVIEENTITNFTRRGIKCQGSGVVIRNNDISNTFDEVAAPRIGASISIIDSNNVKCYDNEITTGPVGSAISVAQAGTAARLDGTSIKNNDIRTSFFSGLGEITNQTGIFSTGYDNLIISGNDIYGGTSAIAIQNSDGPIVKNNTLLVDHPDPSSASSTGINIVTTVSNPVIKGNTGRGNRIRLIRSQAPSGVISNNEMMASIGTCVSVAAGADFTVLNDNVNVGADQPVAGGSSEDFILGNSKSLTSGGSSNDNGRSVFFRDSVPVSTSGLRYNRGDVIFFTLPSASGNVGASCSVSGSPGVWHEFGPLI